jgi:hypothetical protein
VKRAPQDDDLWTPFRKNYCASFTITRLLLLLLLLLLLQRLRPLPSRAARYIGGFN